MKKEPRGVYFYKMKVTIGDIYEWIYILKHLRYFILNLNLNLNIIQSTKS